MTLISKIFSLNIAPSPPAPNFCIYLIFFSCTGSDLVEAEKTGIQIVESPYVLSFKDITKYFKPGLPLDFTVRTTFCVYDPSTKMKQINQLNPLCLVLSCSSIAVGEKL